MFLDISKNSQEDNCARVSFFEKVADFIKKETLAQVFSREFCKISKNTYSYRTLPVAASIYNEPLCDIAKYLWTSSELMDVF